MAQRTPNDSIRIVIADDEPLARELLRSMLTEEPGVEVVAECGDGRQTVEAVMNLAPDLLFLDARMPELDGFDVLARLPEHRTPEVIFATAYDRYAIQAFEVRALDYLLKPFDDERLRRALAHARERLERKRFEADMTAGALVLLDRLRSAPSYAERLAVKEDERTLLLHVETIDWFEADGKRVRAYVGDDAHTIREGMASLAAELDPARFIRVSRSAIVNIDRIREIRPWFQGDYLIVLSTGRQIPTTRSHRDSIRSLLRQR